MHYWLLKTEPEEYSFADLVREGVGRWDGVNSNWALQHLRAMRIGDQAMIYHTGKERRIVGLAEVASEPYADPALDEERRTVVDLRAVGALPAAISLKTIKADARFGELLLVRSSRLSVMPVSPIHWRALRRLGGL